MTLSPEWVSVIAPFVSGGLGVGIAWGVIRQKVIELDRRIGNAENKLDNQVGETRCDKMRTECKTTIDRSLVELKDKVEKNHNYVVTKFDEIARFMGAHNGNHP